MPNLKIIHNSYDGQLEVYKNNEPIDINWNVKDICGLLPFTESVYLPKQICPMIIHDSIPVPHIYNFKNMNGLVLGAIKRVLHENSCDFRVLEEFQSFVSHFIHTNFEPIEHIEISHENLDLYWLDDSKYNLSEKEKFHKCLDDYLDNNLYPDFYACKTFVKKEIYPEIKYPRIISSRSDQFKAVVAPFIKEIEKVVTHNEHYIKGQDKHQFVHRLQQIQDNFCRMYETDYSSFEGSFSSRFMYVCEYQLLRYMLSFNPDVNKIIKYVYKNPNVMQFSFDYAHGSIVCPGSRMSGEMWTSMCNGFTNQMLFLFCVSKTPEADGRDFDYVVEGDDGLLGCAFPLNVKPVSDLGFSLKIVEGECINDLSFCGICTYNDKFIPDFPSTLMKFPFTFNHEAPHSKRRRYELARAKAVSLLYEGSGMPVLQELALRVLRLTKGVKLNLKDFDWWYLEFMLPKDVILQEDFSELIMPVTDDIRSFFEYRFGMSIQDQLNIESEIKNSQLDSIIYGGQHRSEFSAL